MSFAPLLSQSFDPDPNGALGSGFEVLRFVRIIRLQRFLADEAAFVDLADAVGISSSKAFQALGQRQLELYLRVARVVGSILSLLLVATGLVYETEHLVNPQIPTFFDALYFGLTTLTTVGFGDITPVTLGGRVVVAGAIILGLAIVPAQLAELGQTLLATAEPQPSPERLPSEQSGVPLPSAAPPDLAASLPAARRASAVDASLECDACLEPRHLRGSTFCHACGGALRGGQIDVGVPAAASGNADVPARRAEEAFGI